MESSSSSSTVRPKKMYYDVFISFRGKDIRHTFVGYLYDALDRLGIKAFVDEKRFKIGDDLHSLFQIIEESRSAIVVISADYASSKWCLRELTKIMDSMGTTSLDRVLPVFYRIDASTVKHQSGTFEKSFDEHEANALKETDDRLRDERLKDLQNWRKAMEKIGTRTGTVITQNSSEVEEVKKITNQIFHAWRPKLEAVDKNLVGMTSRLLQMNMHLAIGLDDVRFVAIVGMGGIGKTTIARVVFDCLLSKFGGECCFLTLPGGDSKLSLVPVQREMLSKFFQTEDFNIWHEDHGLELIKNRLNSRKVLLVLDRIEEKRQLEKLVGSMEWFGPGSRVIITTRNKELLYQPYNVEIKQYNVEELDHDSALQLFLKHAFGTSQPKNSLLELSTMMVEKVKRLPLALRVIGSYLFNKKDTIWSETLKRLIKIEEKSFFDVLKISYDGLGGESQQVFLDLACFFNGRSEDRVIEILESLGYSPTTEILLLTQRCLIEVSHRKITMHSLILEMGREIVRSQSRIQSGQQSRIWLQEDLYCKFAEIHELKYIEGIVLSSEEEMKEPIQLDAKDFSEMTKLKILEINNVELFDNVEYLSQLLRLINWPGYPSQCLPQRFQSPFLFELLLPHSGILKLWEGKKNFMKLKVIDVSYSEHFLKTPDFSRVPNLERLVVRNCVRLYELHPSITCLNKLILLDLEGCTELKLFPPNLRCKNLQNLNLSGTALEISPEIGGNMERLTQLHLARTNITQLHPSIQRLTGLELLNLACCVRLLSLPCEIGSLRSLKTLLLTHCTKLDQIPPSLAKAKSLQTLSIGATSITHVPSSMHCLRNLKELECEGLPRGIWKSLLPRSNFISLVTLCLKRCKLVDEDVPEDLHCFSSLEILDLSCNDFVKLPDSLSHLKKLKTLNLDYCTMLKDLPLLPPSLERVQGKDCRSISKEFYNKILLVPSVSVYHLHLDFSISSETTKVEYTIDEFRHSVSNRRLYEVNISEGRLYFFSRSKVDIMECFDQINEGDWVNIEYNEESSFNNDVSNVCGVFLSAKIEHPQTSDHFKVYVGKLSVKFEIDGNPSNSSGITMEYEFPSNRSVCVTYLPVTLFKGDLMDKNCCSIKATISCDNKSVVKACGASILSWQNASKYLAKLFTKAYGSTQKFQRIIVEPNHKSECRGDDELEVENEDFPSTFEPGGSDSTFLQRKNLKSILGRICEEARHYSARYFFPQTNGFGWFKNQNKNNKVAVKLPLNIYKDKKWMGLAMFAMLSVSENAEYMSFDYEIHSDMWIQFNRKFFIPVRVLEHSNRILFIVFEPQNWYPYHLNSSSNHYLYISFNSNVERVQVELCGARLVYKQNVEGLVQIIVDSIEESGADLFEYYNQENMNYLWPSARSQNHHDSSLQDGSANNQTTPLSCVDSSFSVEQLLHGSFPHPLLQMSVEERFSRKFDLILHGDVIPKLFTNQSEGNEVRIKFDGGIIPYLDQNPNTAGLAVCAFVAVNQQMRKVNYIQQRERYTKVLDLICKFKVDSYEMKPLHYHFVPQEKLLCQYSSHFIWFFYTPVNEFGITWHNCNCLGITLETSCDELFQVRHCGLRIICKNERKEIDKIIVASTVPPSLDAT